MNLSFNIIDEQGSIIDSFSLNWLGIHNRVFVSNYCTNDETIKTITTFCFEEIKRLKAEIIINCSSSQTEETDINILNEILLANHIDFYKFLEKHEYSEFELVSS